MNAPISHKRMQALATVDAMAPEYRVLVHEFGLPIVQACLSAGVTRPSIIRHLVHEIWCGARQTSQRSTSEQFGPAGGTKIAGHLDWLLLQKGTGINAYQLVRMLRAHNMIIVPLEPGKAMIEASIATVREHREIMTKHEKHRRRLHAALQAALYTMWPQLKRETSE